MEALVVPRLMQPFFLLRAIGEQGWMAVGDPDTLRDPVKSILDFLINPTRNHYCILKIKVLICKVTGRETMP